MGEYTGKLARRIKGQAAAASGGTILMAEYVSPGAIRIGGELFSHSVRCNPAYAAVAETGDTVLAAQIGTSFYIICKVV